MQAVFILSLSHLITGKFRSTASSTLDIWHLAQKFPSHDTTLGDTFIKEAPPVDRIVAVNTEPQMYADFPFFVIRICICKRKHEVFFTSLYYDTI